MSKKLNTKKADPLRGNATATAIINTLLLFVMMLLPTMEFPLELSGNNFELNINTGVQNEFPHGIQCTEIITHNVKIAE